MSAIEIEPSVQMRLYTLNKRHFVLVFAAFFISFGLVILIGLAGPPITETTVRNSSSLQPPPDSLLTGPFELRSPTVSSFHQQLWLIAQIYTDNTDADGMFQHKMDVGITIRGIIEENKSDIVYKGTLTNRTRNLQCSKRCKDLLLLHLGFLNYPNYVITVHFYGTNNAHFTFTNIDFVFKTYNATFTQLEIWIRFTFLVFTFIATCLFAHSLRRFSMRDWSIEQKWMSILLPLLLLYNNPVFPLTFLVDSWVPEMMDAMFQATFLGALLVFWLCLYHGVRQNKRNCSTFYLPKLVLVGLIWIAAVVISSWQEYHELQDPTYNYKLDTGNYMGFKIFFFIMGGIYCLYLIYLLVRAYAELRSMPYFDLRLKFLTALMLIVVSITVTIIVLRFGGSALEGNFVAAISTSYDNSVEFLAFYGLLNFYLYTMAFVYSPSKNAVFESHFKDNPALSMLNDSDDEVIYGSDHEETTVLTRKMNRYDSEEEAFN